MQPRWRAFLLLLLGSAAPAHAAPGDVHLTFGNPSQAKDDPTDRTNFLMIKDQFALSYNDKKGTPNWVSYRLRRQDMGRAPRGIFFPDDELPRGFYQVRPGDYHFLRTGMSRGHLCPNGHRNNTEANARATFVMTNMVPQTEELNAGAWNEQEIWCRDQCFDNNKELWIVCGPHGVGGRSDKGFFKSIGDGRVVVPKSCWKVILVLDAGGKSPQARVTKRTPLIAVVMPNDRTPEKRPWTHYVVSAADVEALTGYVFFDRAAPDVIGPLKKQVWSER